LLGIKRGHCDPEDKKVIEYNSVNKLKWNQSSFGSLVLPTLFM
jgi:hypothetical protein